MELSKKEQEAIKKLDYISDFIIENGQYNADVEDIQHFSKILNLISKYQKILDSFETECRRNLATFRKIRKSEKRDVDLFNQGQEYKCCQFLNLLDGEENWQYEGKLFDKVDEEVKKLKQEAKDE